MRTDSVGCMSIRGDRPQEFITLVTLNSKKAGLTLTVIRNEVQVKNLQPKIAEKYRKDEHVFTLETEIAFVTKDDLHFFS